MKLLISLGIFYPSQVGGPGNALYWVGKELVKNNISVSTIVSDEGVAQNFAPRDKWFNLNGINIKYCKVRSSKSSPKLAWLTIKEIPKSNVVMLSSLFYKPNFFVGAAALIMGKSVIWSPRGELLVPRGVIKRIYLKVIKWLFGEKVLFHATSPEEMVSVQKFMGNYAKCICIPNYMELPKRVESTNKEKYLLYIGRIMPIKALENLIEGIALSKQFKEKKYKLYLAGKNEGAYFERLVALIDERDLTKQVIFKGMVEGEMKECLYAGAKLTMLVSHTENFGNVVIESLAQGTPVIASKGTPWKSLKENSVGYWIQNSPEEIAKAIDHLLSLPENEYQQMRKRAYEFCKDKFDITKNIDKWIELIREYNLLINKTIPVTGNTRSYSNVELRRFFDINIK